VAYPHVVADGDKAFFTPQKEGLVVLAKTEHAAPVCEVVLRDPVKSRVVPGIYSDKACYGAEFSYGGVIDLVVAGAIAVIPDRHVV
jgi:hypothetical protein